jgi:hypothetical protein
LAGKPKYSLKHAAVQQCPQIPHNLRGIEPRVAPVGSRRLTVIFMAQFESCVLKQYKIIVNRMCCNDSCCGVCVCVCVTSCFAIALSCKTVKCAQSVSMSFYELAHVPYLNRTFWFGVNIFKSLVTYQAYWLYSNHYRSKSLWKQIYL